MSNKKNKANKKAKSKSNANSRGRKSLYHTHVQPYLDTIEGMYRDGLTLEDIANHLGVALSSMCNYKNQYKELNDALTRGNQDSIYVVENSLFKSATGFYYTEDELTKSGEVVTITKYAKPNVNAQIFFLKNRARNKWRDKQEHEVDARASVAQVVFTGEDDLLD